MCHRLPAVIFEWCHVLSKTSPDTLRLNMLKLFMIMAFWGIWEGRRKARGYKELHRPLFFYLSGFS